MKKIRIVALMLSLVMSVFCFVSCGTEENALDNVKKETIVTSYQQEEIIQLFDYYEYSETTEYNRITAFKDVFISDLVGVSNVNLSSSEKIRNSYDIQYNFESEIIYLTVSLFDEKENLISVKTSEAFPIYYEDGTFDAMFDIDGKNIYLSEIQTGEIETCFFFSFAASLLIAKVTAALIVAAKTAIVVCGVVAVAGITYSAISLTKAKIQERTRLAEKEAHKKNPKYYYPATRKEGKLLIAANPLTLIQASKEIVKGIDFWSPTKITAKALVVRASGNYIGPEVDSNKPGYYYHFHLANRIGGHSFYGTPTGEVY